MTLFCYTGVAIIKIIDFRYKIEEWQIIEGKHLIAGKCTFSKLVHKYNNV